MPCAGSSTTSREAQNAERLAHMFEDDATVAFPRVYWEYTTARVLTLERIIGIPFNRPDLLDAAGMDRPQLAKRGIYCYLEQIFVHGFYHADPHPGNLFALPDGRVGFTDFGRCGTISKVGRDQLADLFMAIIDDDSGLAVDTLLNAAGNPGDIDVAELEREVSRLITKYYNKSLQEIRMGDLINEVLDLVRTHHLVLSSELAMLLTTLVVLEGLGRLLDPQFDFVAVTAPVARKITSARLSPQALSRTAHTVAAAPRTDVHGHPRVSHAPAPSCRTGRVPGCDAPDGHRTDHEAPRGGDEPPRVRAGGLRLRRRALAAALEDRASGRLRVGGSRRLGGRRRRGLVVLHLRPARPVPPQVAGPSGTRRR